MKTSYHHLLLAGIACVVSCLLTSELHAQQNVAQINWGSQDFSTIVDSYGNPLPADNFTFTFALGAFDDKFTPTESNVEDWFDNWRTFDTANYVLTVDMDTNTTTAVFASSYLLNDPDYGNGTNADFTALGVSRDAYVWVYNSTIPEPGTEWFLARASNWEFPEVTGDCCNNDLPIEWSMSDLQLTNVPLWGNQLGTEGPGEKTQFVQGADLQTYTFIPEPSSALLVALAGVLGVLRRSRPQGPQCPQA